MSKDPRERIDYWKQKEGYTQGRVIAENLTYDQALDREREEAQHCGPNCNQEPGGPSDNSTDSVWSVYRLD